MIRIGDNNRIVLSCATRIFFALFSIAATFIVLLSNCDIRGLEFLFLLPLSFAIACGYFGGFIAFCRQSIGMLVLFFIMLLRYVICPALICLSNSVVHGLNVSSGGFRWAILMMLIELWTVVFACNYFWPKAIMRNDALEHHLGVKPYKLTWTGVLFLLAMAVLLLVRGHLPNVISHMSFWRTAATATDDLYTYDFDAVILIRTVISISLIAYLGKKAKKYKNDIVFFSFALVAAAVNVIFYKYDTRSTIVETAIATAFVLFYCFPKRRKTTLLIAAIALCLLIGENFLGGTVRVGYGHRTDREYVLQQFSMMTELYTNNVSTEGYAFDKSEWIKQGMSFGTFFSDFFNLLGITSLPGLRFFRVLFSNIPTTFSLFMKSLSGKGYILSNAGWAYCYGGIIAGWLFDILIHVAIVWSIVFFWMQRMKIRNEWTIYLCTYCEVICAVTIMNNILIMVAELTALPIYLLCFKIVNDWGNYFNAIQRY